MTFVSRVVELGICIIYFDKDGVCSVTKLLSFVKPIWLAALSVSPLVSLEIIVIWEGLGLITLILLFSCSLLVEL